MAKTRQEFKREAVALLAGSGRSQMHIAAGLWDPKLDVASVAHDAERGLAPAAAGRIGRGAAR